MSGLPFGSKMLAGALISKIEEVKRKKRLKQSLLHLIEITEEYIKYVVTHEDSYDEETIKKLEFIVTEVYSK